jgi:hypothetical protein
MIRALFNLSNDRPAHDNVRNPNYKELSLKTNFSKRELRRIYIRYCLICRPDGLIGRTTFGQIPELLFLPLAVLAFDYESARISHERPSKIIIVGEFDIPVKKDEKTIDFDGFIILLSHFSCKAKGIEKVKYLLNIMKGFIPSLNEVKQIEDNTSNNNETKNVTNNENEITNINDNNENNVNDNNVNENNINDNNINDNNINDNNINDNNINDNNINDNDVTVNNVNDHNINDNEPAPHLNPDMVDDSGHFPEENTRDNENIDIIAIQDDVMVDDNIAHQIITEQMKNEYKLNQYGVSRERFGIVLRSLFNGSMPDFMIEEICDNIFENIDIGANEDEIEQDSFLKASPRGGDRPNIINTKHSNLHVLNDLVIVELLSGLDLYSYMSTRF